MTQTIQQLREDAKSLGLRVHHKHSEEKLREMIDDALVDKKQEPEIETTQTEQPQILLPAKDEPVTQQQNQPIRLLMYKHSGERMWVMKENVQQYFSEGWMLV